MSEKNKKSGILFAAWTVAALIVLIAFLVNGNKIIDNLKSTDFFERVFGSGTTPEFVKNHKTDSPKSNGLLEIEIETEKPEQPVEKTVVPPAVAEQEPVKPVIPVESTIEKEKNNSLEENKSTAVPVESPRVVEKPVEKPAPIPAPAPKPINLKVYFVVIDSDGSINRKEVSRTSTKRDAPLTAAIELLLSGPTVPERNSDYKTLIPANTRLLGAYIKNGVAVLNFSEAFEYNPYGVEGYLGQLMQIVYTATSFSTVNSVQILIEGQKKEYLGSEGVWIGSPLARSSFK